MRMMKGAKKIDSVNDQIKRILVINILIVTVGMLIWNFQSQRDNAIIAIIATLLPIITYFGIMTIFENLDIGLGVNKGSIRTAMVSAVLVFFFFVYPTALFINLGAKSEFGRELTQTFISMITVMIPFYFAASVYTQTHESSKSNGDQSSKSTGDQSSKSNGDDEKGVSSQAK